VLDLSASNFINEVDRFCQYFNIIEKVRLASGEVDDKINQINTLITSSKIIAETKFKTIVNRKWVLEPEMYNDCNVWLIKPNDFNRGRGVMLFNTLE